MLRAESRTKKPPGSAEDAKRARRRDGTIAPPRWPDGGGSFTGISGGAGSIAKQKDLANASHKSDHSFSQIKSKTKTQKEGKPEGEINQKGKKAGSSAGSTSTKQKRKVKLIHPPSLDKSSSSFRAEFG